MYKDLVMLKCVLLLFINMEVIIECGCNGSVLNKYYKNIYLINIF